MAGHPAPARAPRIFRGALFALGCGNGSVAQVLTGRGWDVTGVDPSEEGIAQVRAAYPALKLAEGVAVISTPYHGYWKNLAQALTGKMDGHFTALWDHGHIKFWSMRTLGELLREAGFVDVRFERVGRVPALAKSMVAVARKL
jgi:2-polyprenyl-6-hydroxyphenyl methylase/3-demethylubiquinone-9 3-methyltransferase